ncbi:hypothetical protein GCM10009712_24100 [Pseudarthrobacter sulfonivorans]|uniref:hypothetical protein n=1 Tax=Pseudarthrobacter sulfonivorans TaxID=121292 RepID=UPI00168A9FE5|nr:hypothetical protein [Pseudarthrobacter sulfonivorans]
MTSNTSPLLSTVDEMLLDAGETDAALRAALLSLGAFASLPVPEPRPELAALLSAQTAQLGRHRRRRRHRTAEVGLAVIAGMGLGVSGVAATASGPKLHASPSIQQMLQDWVPSWTIAGTPPAGSAGSDLPGVSAAGPAAEDASAPAAQESTDAEPAGRSPAGQESSASESDAPGRPEHGAVGRSNNRDSADRGAGDPGAGNPGAGSSAADGGASRNAAGATGPGIPQDKTAPEAPPRGAAGAPAGMLEKTGKLVTEAPAVVGNLASAILDPAAKEKTGASDAGPGSIWLKKFNR